MTHVKRDCCGGRPDFLHDDKVFRSKTSGNLYDVVQAVGIASFLRVLAMHRNLDATAAFNVVDRPNLPVSGDPPRLSLATVEHNTNSQN